MSTSETTTFNKGPCPCGQGRLAQHVTTQDNPWSTADIVYSIECPGCSSEWRLDGKTLILRSSEVAHAEATKTEQAAAQRLRALALSIVAHHFKPFAPGSKKAEHAELQRLGITSMSYRQYLDLRRNGGTIATAAAPTRNPTWLRGVADHQGRTQELDELTAAHTATEDARRATYEQVVRRNVA
jgi:hypothetical protein